MEKRSVSVLVLMLSVAGLAASAATGSGETDIIRLPSDGNVNEEPPWKCCNEPRCTRSWPPSCQCQDRVKQCSDACRECVSVEVGREVCADWYVGLPPRRCDEDRENHVVAYGVVTMGAARKKVDDDVERPPWKCCNRAVPGPSTTSAPVWYCMDRFEHCDCEHCMKVEDGHGYFCLDGYKGRDPGPSCTHHE